MMRVGKLALYAAMFGALAGCAGDTDSLPEAPAVASPSVDTSERDRQAAEARASYVMRALADARPPGVKDLREAGVGTGFFIARDRVLTNFHVAGGCTAITVGNNREGEEVDARLEAGDPDLDLAVLSTRPMAVVPARFEMAVEAESGEGLAVVGYPARGLPLLVAELDEVSADPVDLAADRKRYPFSGPVRSGNSGSPVLDNKGAVIGVVSARIDTVSVYQKTGLLVKDVGLAISNRTVFDFLSRNKVGFEQAAPGAALTPEQILQAAHGFVRQIGCWK